MALNLDELVIVIRQASDGYSTVYYLYSDRSPVRQLTQAQDLLNEALVGPPDGTDIQDFRISADKANLKLEIGQAIDSHLG